MKIAADIVPGPAEEIPLALEVEELEEISALPTKTTFGRDAGYLTRMVTNRELQDECVLPLLEEARGRESWYVARRHEASEGSYSLPVFVWPPGSRTEIHDHSTWGVLCSAVGSVLEERYERLDDGLRFDHARLKKVWRLTWRPGEGLSPVLPYDGGIHRIGNPTGEPVISVHLYGPRLGELDGRDYEPARDYVCDRWEER